jgi:hypothetical protein
MERMNCFMRARDSKGGAMFEFERSGRLEPRAGVAQNFRQEIYV